MTDLGSLVRNNLIESPRPTLHSLIGTEVRLYPSDVEPKFAVIEEISSFGILFRVTCAHPNSYLKEGQLFYVSHATELRFVVADSSHFRSHFDDLRTKYPYK